MVGYGRPMLLLVAPTVLRHACLAVGMIDTSREAILTVSLPQTAMNCQCGDCWCMVAVQCMHGDLTEEM